LIFLVILFHKISLSDFLTPFSIQQGLAFGPRFGPFLSLFAAFPCFSIRIRLKSDASTYTSFYPIFAINLENTVINLIFQIILA